MHRPSSSRGADKIWVYAQLKFVFICADYIGTWNILNDLHILPLNRRSAGEKKKTAFHQGEAYAN